MAKTNIKSTMIVSALTFGAGYIIYLRNGAQLIAPVCLTVIPVAYVLYIHKQLSGVG